MMQSGSCTEDKWLEHIKRIWISASTSRVAPLHKCMNLMNYKCYSYDKEHYKQATHVLIYTFADWFGYFWSLSAINRSAKQEDQVLEFDNPTCWKMVIIQYLWHEKKKKNIDLAYMEIPSFDICLHGLASYHEEYIWNKDCYSLTF